MWEQEQWRISRSEMLAGSRGCPRGEHERRSLFTVMSARRHFPACLVDETKTALAKKHVNGSRMKPPSATSERTRLGRCCWQGPAFDGRDEIVEYVKEIRTRYFKCTSGYYEARKCICLLPNPNHELNYQGQAETNGAEDVERLVRIVAEGRIFYRTQRADLCTSGRHVGKRHALCTAGRC